MRKFLSFMLLIWSYSLVAQDQGGSSLKILEEYMTQFGIQFAYNPEKIETVSLSEATTIEEMREVLRQANVAVVEVSPERWLLKHSEDHIKENSINVQGVVKDVDDLPLVNALIYSESGLSSALTDEDGSFVIAVNGEEKVCCQYLGYEARCLEQSKFLAFELEPITMVIDDVKIETKKVRCTMNPVEGAEVIKFNSSSIQTSSLGKDVFRSVQLLSGVDATNDLSSSMSIRASTGLQSLVTMDGIPLYNTESSFGMFSVLNPLVISEARLYKNTMPLEYGEFTGGYLACEGLAEIQDNVHLNIDLNTLQTMAAIQVPLGAKTQLSGAFRRSNGRISNSQYYSRLRARRTRVTQDDNDFNRPEVIATNLENRFGDAYINFNHEWKGSHFRVSLFGNRDISGTSYDGEYTWEREVFADVIIAESYEQIKEKGNVGVSLEYMKEFNSSGELLIRYYSSAYGLEDNIESEVRLTNRFGERSSEFDSQIGNEVRDRNLKLQFTTGRDKPWSWKLGTDFRQLSTDFGFRSINTTPFRQDLVAPIITPYAGVRYNFNKKFVADLGMRYAIIPVENPVGFSSPRAKLLLELSEGWYLKSSASYNQQFFRPIELERQLGQPTSANIISADKNIPILKSGQLTLGMNYFKSGFKVNGDLFVRRNRGILEQVLTNPGIGNEMNVFGNNTYDLFQGVNSVVGIDVSTGYENKEFTVLASYTYSKSEDRFQDLFNNRAIPDQNNRAHQLNLFSSYQLHRWMFSSTWIYGSGAYTLNRISLDEAVERGKVNPSKLFTQLPAYARWDLNASYNIPMRRGRLFLDVGIFNVLNRDNVSAELYFYSLNDENRNAVGASQINLLGRIWSLGVRYELK